MHHIKASAAKGTLTGPQNPPTCAKCYTYEVPLRRSTTCRTKPSCSPPSSILLTTLMVKLAVVAVLATMLVRFPWFRHILLTEKRDWPERLIFAASLGIPLTAGVVARLLLNYDAADLTLAGAFLAGLLAGPYAGAIVGVDGRHPAADRRRMDRAAVRRRLRLRRRRPARDLSEGSDLALLAVRSSPTCTATSGAWCAASRSTGRSCCCSRRSASSCSARRSAPAGAITTALFYLAPRRRARG